MFRLIKCISEVDIAQLLPVYYQSNMAYGEENCHCGTSWEKLRYAEEFFRESIFDFLRDAGTALALWEADGQVVSALRLEPHEDHLLLSCLETVPEARRMGYAEALMRSVLLHYADNAVVIQAHVHKKNKASLALHKKVGFFVIADHARLLDGTVSRQYFTLISK